jgi:hypothetical protein
MRMPGCAKHSVELEAAPADRDARPRQRGFTRRDAGTVVVELADAGVADVEGAPRQGGKRQRALDQAEHLRAQAHGLLGRTAVDARQLGVGLVRAHAAVDAVHLGHHRVDRGLALCGVVGPQLDRDRRAHDGLLALEPARVRIERAVRRHGAA